MKAKINATINTKTKINQLQAIGEDDEDADSDGSQDSASGPKEQMCDMEDINEEMQEAQELVLFETIVKAPLQILDLRIPDPAFFFAKHTGEEQGQKDFILLSILRNFQGTQLKLSNVVFDSDLSANDLDFEWACHTTLRYFKF